MSAIRRHKYEDDFEHFILDTTDDMKYLPTLTKEGTGPLAKYGVTSFGSTAFIIDTNQKLMINSLGEWKDITGSSTTSGSIKTVSDLNMSDKVSTY